MFGTKKSRSRRAKETSSASFDWARFTSAMGTLVLIVVVGAVVAGLAWGHDRLYTRAMGILGGKKPLSVSIAWPPLAGAEVGESGVASRTWLPEQFQQELLIDATGALSAAADPYSREALARVSAAMKTSGWFEGEPAVVRRLSGDVHVQGQWRIGAAVVRLRDGYRLVSWNGKPMPVRYDLGANLGPLTVISGLAGAVPRDEGGRVDYSKTWSGADLEAALELLALVSRQPWRDQIRAIDTAGYPRSSQLAIETVRGGRIVWGGRPTAPLPGETTTMEKLEKLAWFQRQFKSIDGGRVAVDISGQRPYEIDVSATAMNHAQ